MKTLKNYISEKLVINKDYKNGFLFYPEDLDELNEIIAERYESEGEGTEKDPINLNDVDISKLNSLQAAFSSTPIKFLDISEWNVENIKDLSFIFYNSSLEYVNMSNWNIKHNINIYAMFDKSNLRYHSCDFSNLPETEHNIDFIKKLDFNYNVQRFIFPKWYDN